MEMVGFMLSEYFWSIVTGLVALTMGVTGIIGNGLKLEGEAKQVVSWGVSVLLTVATYLSGLFTVVPPAWISLFLIGLMVGLVSNGVYDVPTIKSFINSLTSFGGKKEMPVEDKE